MDGTNDEFADIVVAVATENEIGDIEVIEKEEKTLYVKNY